MDKNYLLEQYRLAILDFQTAHNEDEQWQARKSMAKLETTAISLFGNELDSEFERMKDTIR